MLTQSQQHFLSFLRDNARDEVSMEEAFQWLSWHELRELEWAREIVFTAWGVRLPDTMNIETEPRWGTAY